ncbi:hypothetical protein SAMN05444007_102307 [Cribrihabitans marinus]|uniref:Uncharacterized protein n=1 Tax=Cribrihabitans marinus TaxID=1227549 RepID=A0A1H6T9Q9_9RHOB|nr:hypothetical protein [Cribrihabitans marinus]GGH22108.1 hypothetical protein GCM10010973_07180 [Cribrihabitans marinus]SEI76833.1 hypothetical protein SAMN05444007_102307 [Cribrihabitans marinus]
MPRIVRKPIALTLAALFSAAALGAQPAQADDHEVALAVYLTGYSYWDNTPPGSTAIARPVVNSEAGGEGTYERPITIAVGHAIENGTQTLQFPEGTRFYLRRFKKYAIVEDVCGDGDRPQDGPCYVGYRGHPWLDLYIGGSQSSQETAVKCARHLTGLQMIILNPDRGYEVVPGAMIESGCRAF